MCEAFRMPRATSASRGNAVASLREGRPSGTVGLTTDTLDDMALELIRAKQLASGDQVRRNEAIVRVKAQLVRLVAQDLSDRIRWSLLRHTASGVQAPVDALLLELEALACSLHESARRAVAPADRPRLKADMRQVLWELRTALDPLQPPELIRTMVEELRSALMDNSYEKWSVSPTATTTTTTSMPTPDAAMSPGTNGTSAHDQVTRHALQLVTQENALMLELLSLRILHQEVQRAVYAYLPQVPEGARAPTMSHLETLNEAAAHLRIGTYRVRGRSRLRQTLGRLHEHLERSLGDCPDTPSGNASAGLPLTIQRPLENLRASLFEETAYAAVALGQPPVLHGESMLLRPRFADIPNFEIVEPATLLRGGQPTAAGMRWLMDYGVRASVDLRGTDRGNQWDAPDSASWGPIRRYHIAIEDFQAPTFAQVLSFVDLVNEASNRPLYVSCKAGIGRTGTMVACWRIAHGASVDQALKQEHLYATDGGGLRQEAFVRSFADRWTRIKGERETKGLFKWER
ncbi:hypothetical protein CDCA_CDCA09G2754 [Cyanidium caldarium]|uniref:Tyrosine specific protein phosphatases domain-containing protein n=1 Tax=Cyanidium caldarium TaxID=2771 RepID=A0AAV9IWS6_CYACA|nr:hypothetical protein CDCA_CDCA09G2754 [Cyanidium caldarium]